MAQSSEERALAGSALRLRSIRLDGYRRKPTTKKHRAKQNGDGDRYGDKASTRPKIGLCSKGQKHEHKRKRKS
jgi:hypothetical protein